MLLNIGYTCFPWIFNPGCYLNGVVNWCLVCRTNTLGWEQCDVDKQNEVKCKEYSSFFNFEKEASPNNTNKQNLILPVVPNFPCFLGDACGKSWHI